MNHFKECYEDRREGNEEKIYCRVELRFVRIYELTDVLLCNTQQKGLIKLREERSYHRRIEEEREREDSSTSVGGSGLKC